MTNNHEGDFDTILDDENLEDATDELDALEELAGAKKPDEEDESDGEESKLKSLIDTGKEQGYLTYTEVNDHLPDGIVDPEQIEDIVSMINDMGITVHEEAPDADALMLMEATDGTTDEDAAEEAAAALATLDSEFGRTTDPVRMYMREIGRAHV